MLEKLKSFKIVNLKVNKIHEMSMTIFLVKIIVFGSFDAEISLVCGHCPIDFRFNQIDGEFRKSSRDFLWTFQDLENSWWQIIVRSF